MASSPEEGLRTRRMVLGDEYVARAYESATEFSRDLQEFLVEHCWGAVWVRPGLSRECRSIVTLTVLACRGNWTEFRAHIGGAFRNGLTVGELREVLLHLGVYAGAPTAVEAFRVAKDVVLEWEASGSTDQASTVE